MLGGSDCSQPFPAMLYLYMNDVGSFYARAYQADAIHKRASDQPYGDRIAGVKDPFGNVWYIATHKEDVAM